MSVTQLISNLERFFYLTTIQYKDHVVIPLDHVTGLNIFTQKWEIMVQATIMPVRFLAQYPHYMFPNKGARGAELEKRKSRDEEVQSGITSTPRSILIPFQEHLKISKISIFLYIHHYIRQSETLESLKIYFTHSLGWNIVNMGNIGNEIST